VTTEQPNIQTTEGQARLKAMGIKPLPAPDKLTRPYWEAAKRNELHMQNCTTCGNLQFPPEERCLQCNGSDLGWKQVSGRGVIHSFIVDHRLMTPGFDEPYIVAQIRPIEATNQDAIITANMRDCTFEQIAIDMQVEVVFEALPQGITLPQFRPLL